jgi:hypothetical protein
MVDLENESNLIRSKRKKLVSSVEMEKSDGVEREKEREIANFANTSLLSCCYVCLKRLIVIKI